jgi:hypothetical protein
MSDSQAGDEAVRPPEGDDVEGSSLSIVIGLGQLAKSPSHERSARAKPDAALTPLTKPFPRMKDGPHR